jgi:hypothetical protein
LNGRGGSRDRLLLRSRRALLRALARIEAEPSLLGASPHLLAVGVKP